LAAASSHADTVYVRFEINAPTAHDVHLAGDFSGWQPNVSLVKDKGGTWVATVPVAVGVHRYQFVVDDAWQADPAAGGVDDGFGGRNSVVVVGPKGVVRS
jgi:1,4-alpha-glucan branching enzyme